MDKCVCTCDVSVKKDFNKIFFKDEFYDFEIRDNKYYVFPEPFQRQVGAIYFWEDEFYQHFKDIATIVDEKITNLLK
jgi:hypothetical protein